MTIHSSLAHTRLCQNLLPVSLCVCGTVLRLAIVRRFVVMLMASTTMQTDLYTPSPGHSAHRSDMLTSALQIQNLEPDKGVAIAINRMDCNAGLICVPAKLKKKNNVCARKHILDSAFAKKKEKKIKIPTFIYYYYHY